MSELVLDPQDPQNKVRESIRSALQDRRRYEPTWHSNLAFAAGKFRHVWNRVTRRLEDVPDPLGKEFYSADVITEYRTTALGEMGSDDERPELLLRRDDQVSEDFQAQLNRALGWGWEEEWAGDDVLRQVDRMLIDLGTAAVRCRWDPSVGPVMQDNVPFQNGKPVLDTQKAADLFSNGPNPDVQMRSIQEGRICWEALSPFNLIVPSGIPHERDFPWECVVRPAPLDEVKAIYGAAASSLSEDGDIGSTLGLDTTSSGFAEPNAAGQGDTGGTSKLKGHVWLYTYYERPTAASPQGRMMVFGGKQMKLLSQPNLPLPYKDARGDPCSGIVYFHWWRVTARFWSRSLVEGMKDIQRAVNKRRTQINEIIDRGLPAIFVDKNSPAKERRGLALEIVELRPNERQPFVTPSVNPGQWMYQDIEAAREDLEHATGIRAARLGENPVNVTTYAQLAQLNENDSTKRQAIYRERKQAIAKLVEYTVYDIRTYWGNAKQLMFAGEDDLVEAKTFNATKIPTFFIVKAASGAAKPRSQAAELKKMEEIWAAVLSTQTFMAKPYDWVKWLKDSLDAGQALDMPDSGTDMHEDKAKLENSTMLHGRPVPVQYYDPSAIHIPIHRELQIEAELNDDLELWQRIEQHIRAHVLIAQQTAATMTQMQPQLPAAPTSGSGDPIAGGDA